MSLNILVFKVLSHARKMNDYIEVLGEEMPRDMYQNFVNMITPSMKECRMMEAPEDFTCPVCRDGSNSTVIVTDCGHLYHLNCLEYWMRICNNCPLCRHIMPGCDKKLVEELITRARENIKLQILHSWYSQLHGLTREELLEVKEQMQSFVDSEGWNTAEFTMTVPQQNNDTT